MKYNYNLYNKLFNSYKPNPQENRIYYNFKRNRSNFIRFSINNRRKPKRTTTRKLNYNGPTQKNRKVIT